MKKMKTFNQQMMVLFNLNKIKEKKNKFKRKKKRKKQVYGQIKLIK